MRDSRREVLLSKSSSSIQFMIIMARRSSRLRTQEVIGSEEDKWQFAQMGGRIRDIKAN